MKAISIDRLREVFSLDHETGAIFCRVNRRKAREGARAEIWRSDGYAQVCVDGEILLAHRVAFALANGRWPQDEVDHANGNRADNRPHNLREATKSQNGANKRTLRDNALKGASWCKRAKRWRAAIRKNGKMIHIGLFDTQEAAHTAYVDAARRYHGEFARAA